MEYDQIRVITGLQNMRRKALFITFPFATLKPHVFEQNTGICVWLSMCSATKQNLLQLKAIPFLAVQNFSKH